MFTFTFPMDWAMEKASFILQVFIDLLPIASALGDPQSGRRRQTHKHNYYKRHVYNGQRKKEEEATNGSGEWLSKQVREGGGAGRSLIWTREGEFARWP